MYKGKYIKYLTASRRRKYPQRTLNVFFAINFKAPKNNFKIGVTLPKLKTNARNYKVMLWNIKKKTFPQHITT